MANEVDITAVLKVQDSMSQALQRIESQIKDFGDQFKAAGAKVQKSMEASTATVEKSGKTITSQLQAIDKQNLKSIERFTKMTARLAGMQAGLAALGNVAGQSGAEMSKGFKVASNALNTFGSVVAFLPTPAGAAAGAIGALMTALVQLVDTVEGRALLGLIDPDVEKRFKALNERTAKLREDLTVLDDAWKRLGVSIDLTSRDRMDAARQKFSALQQQALKLSELLPTLKDELQGAANALKGTALSRDRKLVEELGLAVSESDVAGIQRLMFRLQELNDGHGGTEYTREAISKLIQSFMNWQNVSKRLESTLSELRTREIGLVNQEVEKLSKNLETIALIGAESVKHGLQTPLEAAATEASAAKANVAALLSLIQKLKNSSINDPETRKQIDGLVKSLEGSTLGQFIGKARETESTRLAQEEFDRQQKELARLRDLWSEMNPTVGWSRALDDLKDKFMTFRDVAREVILSIEHGFSEAFQGMMEGGKKFRDRMRSFFKDIGQSFKRMISDFIAQQLRLTLTGGIGGSSLGGAALMAGGGTAAGLGVGAAASGAGAGAGGSLAGSAAGAAGGGFLSSLFAGGGLGAVGGPLVGLAGIGLGLAGISQGKPALGAAGGALAGFAIGGPIGGLIGGAVGLIGGLFSKKKKKKAKKKAKRQAEEAARALAAAQEGQRKEAERLAVMHIRSTMGGGLATTGAAEEIGAMFSGGLSADELNRLGGAEAINSKAAAIENQSKIVNIAEGAVKIEAAVSGSYDVRQLLEDVNSELGQLGNI